MTMGVRRYLMIKISGADELNVAVFKIKKPSGNVNSMCSAYTKKLLSDKKTGVFI